jgi:hypothetical protein
MGQENPLASFTERYRGTEWDRSAGHPASISFEGELRRGSSVLLYGGVVLVVVLLAFGGFYGLSGGGLQGLVGGTVARLTSTPTPRPTSAPVLVVPTNAPGTAAGPSAQPAKESTGPVAPADAAGAFVAFLQSGTPYVMTETGTITARGEVLHMSMSLRASNHDSAASFVLKAGRISKRGQTVSKAGTSYRRDNGGAWKLDPNPNAMTSNLFVAFPATDWLSLVSVGTERRNGEKVTHLRVPDLNWDSRPPETTYSDGMAIKVDRFALDIWVGMDGVPAGALLVAKGTAQKQGVETSLTIRLRFTFSKVGAPVEIAAPELRRTSV